MSIQKDSIGNFFGGVSQQTDKLMYPNQAKALINHIPDVVEGLKRRPPSQYVAKLNSNVYSSNNIPQPKFHTVIKEDDEYIVMLDGTTCTIWNMQGQSQNVYISSEVSSSGYLSTSNPVRDLVCTTLGDTTYIVNKAKTVQMNSGLFKDKQNSSGTQYVNHVYVNSQTHQSSDSGCALVFVKQGNFSTEYTLSITVGNVTAEFTKNTSDDDITDIRTTKIAKDLKGGISTALEAQSLLTEFSITIQGSTILIMNIAGHTFDIDVEDSNGNQNLLAFQNEATSGTDLPTAAWRGYILKITNQAKDGVGNYYVRFQTDNKKNKGTGSWVECPDPNSTYSLNISTMPMRIRPSSRSGYPYELTRVGWGDRLCGDEDSAPQPSFIGKKIQEVFAYKGRIGFIAGDKAILSNVNNIQSFWRSTVMTNLETDPIDVGSNSKLVDLKHSLPFNEELVLFSDTSQFALKGGDTFSNSTVSIDLCTAYQCSPNCKPLILGSNGYFIYENGSYTRLMSMFVNQNYTIDAVEVTTQCPSYIANDVFKIAGSTANHILVALSKNEPDTLAIYNFYTNADGSNGQSAWSKWKFKNAKIYEACFDFQLLYLVTQYSDGIYLEKIDLTPKLTESTVNYLFYLDRKVHKTGTYNSSTDTTSFTFSEYTPDADRFKVIDTKGFERAYTKSGTTYTIRGNHTDLIVGEVYTSYWELPHIYVRGDRGNEYRVREGILMLRDITLTYAESGYFVVKVTPKFTTQIESEFKFTGMICGLPSAEIGKRSEDSGTFLIPVIAKNDEIDISITNDSYLPSCYLALEWIGDYVQRGSS